MKNTYIKGFIGAMVAVLAITWTISIAVLYYSQDNQSQIQSQVSYMSHIITDLDSSVKNLTHDNQIKTELIGIQEVQIKLKDSLLNMSQSENQSLKNRLVRTQKDLQQTQAEIKAYAAKLDSIQSLDSLHFERFDLSPDQEPR